MRTFPGLVGAMALLVGGSAWADTWLPPSTRTYLSQDGQWRLTVVPRGIASPLRYFQDKVVGLPRPGAIAGGSQQPLGQMEHRVQGRWQPVWRAALVNETSPVSAIVSPQGAAVSFDNWHSAGHGDDTVVVYDPAGRKIRALALADFLPRDYVRALPRSVSSIGWGGDHGFSPDGRQLILRVVVPQKEAVLGSVRPDFVEVRLDMTSGDVLPPGGPGWDRALEAARLVSAERDAMQAKLIADFRAPLAAPVAGDDDRSWRDYLVEAYFRVVSDADPMYPAIGFLAAGRPEDDAVDQQEVRQALKRAQDADDVVVVLGSADPARLVRALRKVIAELPPNGLQRAHVYVTVTPASREAAALALAPSGAAFIALDISAPIPQSPERLKRWSEAMGAPR